MRSVYSKILIKPVSFKILFILHLPQAQPQFQEKHHSPSAEQCLSVTPKMKVGSSNPRAVDPHLWI